jgi:GDPmannose 4,6-dehydratase
MEAYNMKNKTAFITGITGMDGSHLSELLLSKGYAIHGLVRRTSQPLFKNIEHIQDKIIIHYGDMTDSTSIHKAIKSAAPDEIYNFAGMSQVWQSYKSPLTTMDINCMGLIRIIESVLSLELDCKIYQATSSECFGKVMETPQTEKTPFYPRSPYGVSKSAAYQIARLYRESYNMKIYCGWLFNHCSPRRGEEFLERKVSKGVAAIVNGKQNKITLGNLDAKRDWGYAVEYVEWIYRIMQHHTPDDFLIATGETHSVEEFVKEAFACVGIENWEDYIETDESLKRPAEVDLLLGNPEKSRRILGFEPRIKFKELVKILVEHELSLFNR